MNLAWLLLATIPYDEPVAERVDSIDRNHVLCPESGRETFCQLVFLDDYPAYERTQIVAWRMADKLPPPSRVWPSGEWEFLWLDGDVIRRVRTRTLWESFEVYDYETAWRADFPPCKRRELSQRPQ